MERSLLIGGEEPPMHACSLKSILHSSFQLESLSILPGLQRIDGVLLDRIWNVYDKLPVEKLLVKFLSYNRSLWRTLGKFELLSALFVGPKAVGFLQACFWVAIIIILLNPSSFAKSKGRSTSL